MSVPGNGREPSMEEILASIRNMVSQDPSPGEAGTAAPELPNPTPTQQQSTGGELNGAAPAQHLPPHSGPAFNSQPDQLGKQRLLGQQDDDDLADLLEEPLPPAAVAPGPFSAEEQAAPINGPAPSPPNTGAASLGFDFGSLVPRRDHEPSNGSGPPTPGLSRPGEATSKSDFTPPPHAKAPNDSQPLSWADSMRSNEAAHNESAAPAPSEPQSAASPPAGSSANGFAGLASEKSVTSHADPRGGDQPAQESPGRFFPGPLTGKPLPDRMDAVPVQSTRSEEKSPALPTPPQSKPSAPVSKGEGASSFPSFFNSRPTTPAKDGQSDNKASPNFPSIEPVLKAFEKIDSKTAEAAAGPSDTKKVEAEKVVGASVKPVSGATNLGAPLVSVSGKEAAAKTGAAAGRSLEDAVMELLRPMLREWLDDNLPRIIEDTVRREVSNAVKVKTDPGSKA
ncbi:DUF2497 domain-containing protein [Filomicrobium sp.]|uniref:DUF2497 domain-containing protein n=1 Tax=Filomicrobium sp. TaxID=2024831 RepID=UPI00258B7395|nr:DUF2497 domain-containing protein [Filomicrobium sp.]